ncbi:YALI0D13684p [Yarrowia lipolytica CLIB122]|uniref:YALI0D13684p n=1 Tax=Yarrowia lipolytica (strain CLIB 122 / E 150) TaxID=284591 RepID=Q6C964_YARLI|nr:YALI0D13684p [Yarrowia lipolytica CLIB122]KAB8285152.1 hypothetical protein BKA91DRAFT_108103 [Yarrowia lipolytica]KAE8171482.1 hypothetical protein BKA90DRAFT_114024 [Yarrowia lipolytica]KAJ8054416.1 hypothetical protein LXG23DRAFT_19863 [Yarrowia lipolytica]RMI97413.1 hypothetical protein BD777DRAFT_115172 [Yarrowia lipolytica]CAG80986.1 YALI0D13684p [Yarrowia lipolytica CLIB122]|eukprot:XP_502798.1 YALI0D13684p [Yarrowia lipolytica CLIB122]
MVLQKDANTVAGNSRNKHARSPRLVYIYTQSCPVSSHAVSLISRSQSHLTQMYSSSPPTKTSLVSWWKTFKMRPKDHPDLATSPTTQMLAPPGMPQGSLSPGPTGMLERPKLPHMSRSNGEWSSYNAATALDEELEESVIFGVPLASSIQYANVSISLTDPNGEQFIYGHIPIVVAKCGVYLKEHATGVEGIFRVSGSAKRMRDLQRLFNTPPRYGKGLDWSGFNVHDAANVLRRYLNHLPEPIVPLEFYEQFRKPLRNSPSILEYIENKSPAPNAGAGGGGAGAEASAGDGSAANPTASTTSVVASEHNASVASLTSLESTTTSMQASTTNLSLDDPLHTEIVQTVAVYQDLIARLPNLNRQLLMYILDLLAVFASKSEENLMPAPNLAAIFQPSILFHPDHDMMPREYRLSRSVIEFMIEHSNKFLSTIETIAREEHARNKELGIKPMAPSPQVSVTSTIAGQEAAAAAGSSGGSSSTSSGLMPPGRRHSKSMSSVNAPPAAGPASTPVHVQAVPQQPREQLVVRKPRESDRVKEDAVAAAAAATPEKGGLLNTIKRASSLSRRPSQRRTSSNSSQTSELQRSSTINRGYRKSSVKSDESAQGVIPTSAPASIASVAVPAAPTASMSMQSPAPSIQINQIPHSEQATASIPGPSAETGPSSIASSAATPAGTPAGTPTVAAAAAAPLSTASPRVLSPSTEPKSFLGVSDEGEHPGRMSRRSSHEKSGSPRFRVLGNVFGHSNDSASSLSGMTRSVSSSSIDGDGVGAEERPKSRWRRSFIFMQPNNSNPAIDDPNFAAPPVRSPGEVSMDDYSMSPSKLSFFKRMRSRERGSQDVERPSSSADATEPPTPPSATAVQAAAAAAAAAGGHGHGHEEKRAPVVKKPVSSPASTSPTATTHTATSTASPAPSAVKKVPVPSAGQGHGHVVQGHVVQGQPVQGQASPAAQVQPQIAIPVEAHSAHTQAPSQAQPQATVSKTGAPASASASAPAPGPAPAAAAAAGTAQPVAPLQTIQSMIEPEIGESAATSTAATAQSTPATSS